MELFRYEKVFRVRLLHFYYRSKSTGDLGCHPTEECIRQLNNYDLRFKKENDGFSIYGASDGSGNLLKPITDSLKFSFGITLLNPYFINFTDLPLNIVAKNQYYFNNLAVNKVTPDGMNEQLLLNQDGQVSINDLIPVRERYFPFTTSGAGDTATALLKGVENDVEYREQEVVKSGGKFSFNFELKGLKSGRYKGEVGGVEQGTIYYPSKGTFNFGYLEIFTDVPNDHKFTNASGKILPKDYSILFMNRETFWRYRVYNPGNMALPDPEVSQASQPLDFDHLGGLVFVSQDTIPLSEEIIKDIVLKADKADANSIVISHLPNPAVSLLTPDTVDPTKVFSDIHIYI